MGIIGLLSRSKYGTFTNKGIEFETRYQICENLSMNLNYSYLHMSKPIPGAPGQKFYVGAVYKPGRFTLNVNVQSIFDLYTNEGCTEKEDFTTLNAKAAYRFGTRDKGLNLFVKGENLTATVIPSTKDSRCRRRYLWEV